MNRPDDVLAQAMTLTDEARAEIALQLLDSLAADDARTDGEWIAEVERRAERVVSGQSNGSSWDAVRARVEARVAKR